MTQRIRQKGVGLLFPTSSWLLVQSLKHNASNVNRSLVNQFQFVSCRPRQQIRTSGLTTGEKLHNRGIPWAVGQHENSLVGPLSTSLFSAVLIYLFCGYNKANSGFCLGVRRKASWENIDPHLLLPLQKKCHSRRGQ